MFDLVEKRKKKEQLEIAERKVEKAWTRASKINKKLKRAKKKNEGKEFTEPLKDELQNAYKRLKRNKRELRKVGKKVI